ncbi:MAG: CDP-diacylglycerol--glycerol-3-phosphate 3-phosphatidyltransferase [Lachnospiraceae bacterium]|nr:CDP-diacylglycerol--glycerol-3-phosphate 3-phosphatidyltransferase [Lachnospiraceae bacterium]
MNLPNKLTTFRVVLIPFFIFFLMTELIPYSKWIALAIFCIASLTDFFDGYLARKWNMVTNFGKFMDPLADKLLVCSAIIAFTAMDRMPAWIVIIIVAREFIISGFRLIAAEKGVVIAASYWGKFKTASQMFMIILFIINIDALFIPGQVLMYIALALTVISLIDYIIKNKDVMKDEPGEA